VPSIKECEAQLGVLCCLVLAASWLARPCLYSVALNWSGGCWGWKGEGLLHPCGLSGAQCIVVCFYNCILSKCPSGDLIQPQHLQNV